VSGRPSILCFATKGAGSNEEQRIRELLAPLEPQVWAFDRATKGRSGIRLLRALRATRPQVAVMEGTGIAGGLALMLARRLYGVPYVVSSGDAIAPFLAMRAPAIRPLAAAYERLLYRWSAGFIGWTPYLTGRAVHLGAPRGATAEHWSMHAARPGAREQVRARLGIAPEAIVFGIAGSLNWSATRGYCYGLELVRAVRRCSREDVVAVIVGDGTGRAHLEREAGPELGRRVLLPGAVPGDQVPDHLAAFDVGSLPQSMDGVGIHRYTTKLSEYVAAGLPVVTGRLPFAYDLDEGWLFRLAGRAPWDERYVRALADLMQTISGDAIARAGACVQASAPRFERDRQQRRISAFVRELVAG
jgi:glycosyltransferase involved in cell wall biosynthesis